MGEIILNGKSYNSGMKYKEVTQAEYNALPSSKLTDGTLYCITDAPGPGEGFPPMIYSYEEREVGVWVDGKPLYQKTIDCGTLPNKTTKNVAHNISNLDKVYDISGVCIYSPYSTTIPKVHDNNANNQIVFEVGDTNITISSRNLDSSAGSAYVTIQYTKTTDTPGSGKWTTQGIPTHHYDGNEKIIGTWFGETLYERSWELTVTNHSSHWITFMECAIPNFKATINVEWSFPWGQRSYCPWDNNGTFLFNKQSASSAEFYAQSNQYSGNKLYYTVRYTKTSSSS